MTHRTNFATALIMLVAFAVTVGYIVYVIGMTLGYVGYTVVAGRG